MASAWPKRIDCGHGGVTFRNGRKTGTSEGKIRTRFWPGTQTGENVAGGPICPGFDQRSADAGNAESCDAGDAARRGWTIALQVREVNSGAARREARETLLEAARRREIDLVLVWRLDRWGRSVTDLLATLQELEHLGVGLVSLTEALDLTTPAGRAMAGLLAIFAEFEREVLRERTRAGLAHARANGKRLGRPATAAVHAAEIRKLHRAGASKSEIARRVQIGRTSVRRILRAKS